MADNLETLAIQPNVYYTVEETAQLLRVRPQAVLRLLRSGKASGLKIGREWRILGGVLLSMSLREHETEASLMTEWLSASRPSLREVWDNEEDALYDLSAQDLADVEQNRADILGFRVASAAA